ncbi:MAG TPA: hypothetical protein VLH61_04565 [Bacteroidales bacterium]|nr:hypothetical protein [Bacteroidales bacterium]
MSLTKNYKAQHRFSITSSWVVFWLIWPFGALVRALKQFRSPVAPTVFWLFCVYFGFVFIIAEDVPGAIDSTRIATSFTQQHQNPLTLPELTGMFFLPETGLADVYLPLIIWLVAFFTGNPQILFLVFAAVFGFFYTKNLWFIYNKVQVRVGLLLFLFMLAFALANPIWAINSVRMWTAAQIFVFGILTYTLNNSKRGLLVAGLSMLVHFSFFIPYFLFLAWYFLPKRITVFMVLYIITAFVSEIDLAVVRDGIARLPDFLQVRMEGYATERRAVFIAERIEAQTWHVALAAWTEKILIYAWAITLFYYHKNFAKTLPEAAKLFSLALFLGAFANLAMLVPSGERFIIISDILFLAVIIWLFGVGFFNKKAQTIKLATYPVIVFSILFSVRMGMGFFGISALISNPFIAMVFADQVPLIDFIKRFF